MVTTKMKWILGKRTLSVAVFPFIIIRESELGNNVTINHEKIHLQQQKELLIIGFVLWYFIEYLIHLIKYRNGDKAYLKISFEQEAYGHQSDYEYLKIRRPFSFFRYLRL